MSAAAHSRPNTAAEAVKGLRILHDESALMNAVAFGNEAIRPLRELLNEREPSGIYQPRCRAAKALGMVGACDVLLDFLKHPRVVDNDIERAGEDAVINAAGMELATKCDPVAYATLKAIAAERPCLMGVVAALGAYRTADSIPELVAALAEDGTRPVAEAALVAIGEACVPALIAVATSPPPEGEVEYSTSARKRRSAVKVLAEIGVSSIAWGDLTNLMSDRDKWVSVLACELALKLGTPQQQEEAKGRLRALRRTADIWLLMHIDALLELQLPPRRANRNSP
jgi:hypothetical protein